jgi:diacylglycerol O-acyltransferase / wax synthase
VMTVLDQRLPSVPRLRQRLVRLPPGWGRPIWVDDPRFRLSDHVSVVQCPAPGGREAVLEVAARTFISALPPDRPLWAATLVTDVGDGLSALVLGVHHVMADGLGGLALLATLADDRSLTPERPFPLPPPTRAQLITDSAWAGVRAVGRFPAELVGVARTVVQFRPALRTRLTRSSLNRPTGRRRRFVTASCDLDLVREVAHRQGATVNDVVLSAVTGALRGLLAGRGEVADSVVISVPVSFRPHDGARALGNQSAVVPIRLPAAGLPLDRVRAVAQLTRAAKGAAPGASNALLRPVFQLLSGLGLYQWFIDHQRLIHTFVTNLMGPKLPLHLGGYPVLEIIPLATAGGNITVSFVVLSYVGRLTITLIADPETCPDLGHLQEGLKRELDAVTAAG